jgi:hypothetical protein
MTAVTRIILALSLSLACIGLASAMRVTLEATGVVTMNQLGFGPLYGVPVGSAAHLTFDVDSEDFIDLDPGHDRSYAIINDSYLLTAGNGAVHITQGEHRVEITNDYWTVDGVHWFLSNIGGGYWFEFELWGNNGVMFPSCDITQCFGSYTRTLFADSSWMINDVFYVRFDRLIIRVATSDVETGADLQTETGSWGRIKGMYR